MIRLKKIQGLWAITDDDSRDILECFDTKDEAARYYEPYRIRQGLEEFDQKRDWKSLWDEEKRRMEA